MRLNVCGREAVRHKLKNSQKTQKKHFQPVLELMSDSLTTIYVEPDQCPSHHAILLTQGQTCEIFTKKFYIYLLLNSKTLQAMADFFWRTLLEMSITRSLILKRYLIYISTEQARFTNAQNWSNFCNSNFEPYLVFQKCNFLKAFVGLFVLVFLKYRQVKEIIKHLNTYVNSLNSDKKFVFYYAWSLGHSVFW